MHRKFIYFLMLFCLVSTNSLSAQSSLQRPLDFSQVEFFLHTLDVGSAIAEKYGHTQIRMLDQSRGQDVVFSWGLFDFAAPNFVWNFYRGILLYEIGGFSMQRALAIYRHDQRPVWEDRINLTDRQKERLFERIAHDLLPENRQYEYQYFFDNCSTRPRDFIDDALNGAFYASFEGQTSEASFRDMVRKHQATTIFSGMALEILMNSRLDRPMSVWEEMFLPMRLRERLQDLPMFDDHGEPIAETSLLEFTQRIVEGKTYRASFLRDDLGVWVFVGLPLLLFLIFTRRRRKTASIRALGLGLIVWGAVSFLFSVLMISNWAISEHLDVHHNANLLFFWPIDFLFVIVGVKLFLGRSISEKLRKWTVVIAVAHVFVSIIAVILQFTPIIAQDLLRVFASFGVLGIIYHYFVICELRGKRSS